jgi:hypothetical protein
LRLIDVTLKKLKQMIVVKLWVREKNVRWLVVTLKLLQLLANLFSHQNRSNDFSISPSGILAFEGKGADNWLRCWFLWINGLRLSSDGSRIWDWLFCVLKRWKSYFGKIIIHNFVTYFLWFLGFEPFV